jgi:hypothetical protein
MRRDSIVLCSLVIILGFSSGVGAQEIPLMIPHSGTVSVNGQPFNGTGQFKFAIINKQGCGFATNDGCVTYWSSDGTSSAGSMPDNDVPITVNNGLFSVKLGDTGLVNNNGGNMPEIPVSVFSNSETYLRIWFNDGTTGFQRLVPDRQLVSVPYAYRAEVANSVVGTNTVGSTGNVGIGTASPSSTLHVKTAGDYAGEFEKSSPDANAWIKVVNDARSYLVGVRGDTADAFTIFDNVASVNRFMIDTAGNVGIGTSSPDTTLHVRKDLADHVRFLTLGNQFPGGWGAVGLRKIQSIVWRDSSSAGNITAGWGALYDNGTNTVDLTAFGLYNSGYKTEADRVFTIKGSGNVGIGTTNPTFPLHVKSGINSGIYEGRTDGVNIGGISVNQSSRFGGVYQTNPIPGAAIQFVHQGSSGQEGAIAFLTKSTDDDTIQPGIRAVIAREGNVGIGTTNPTSTLHVAGTFTATGTKAATVETASFGQRKLYAVEAPTVRFTDEGTAMLSGGVARVELDPIFSETIEGELLIHVTPYGRSSLYVEERGNNYFVVKSIDETDIPFAWSVSATRKGYSDIRMEGVKPLSSTTQIAERQ